MGIIKGEDVACYFLKGAYYCTDCMDDEDIADVPMEDILTQDYMEGCEDFVFCDSCKCRIA